MKLYEIKLEIFPNDKEVLINDMSLSFIKKYSDLDIYIQSENLTEKIKELDDIIKHYQLFFDGDVFDITGEKIDTDQADRIKKKGIKKILHRTKEVYHWPDENLECAFDKIDEGVGRLFFEVYSRDRKEVIKAKDILVQKGYTSFITQSYDEVL